MAFSANARESGLRYLALVVGASAHPAKAARPSAVAHHTATSLRPNRMDIETILELVR
jgi:hypothetical protein